MPLPTADLPANSFCSLAGRRAVVTGASSGIGRAIALEFAGAGADVLIHCRASHDRAAQVAADCRLLGVRSSVLAADLADLASLPRFVEQAWRLWEGVDIWVNNAGVDLLTGDKAKFPYEEKLRELYEIDVRGTVLLSHAIGERMRSVGGGTLLNIGWDQADRGMEGASGELFAVAKNAVMGFTRSLAVSLAPVVRVNCIAPGWIRTAWGDQASDLWQQRVLAETPLKRWGIPQDIANLARFLCSDEAGYLSGQVINANGGAVR